MRIFYPTMQFINPETLELNNGGVSHYIYKKARNLVDKGHNVNVVMGADRNGYIKLKGINVYLVKVKDSPVLFFKQLFMSKEKKAFYKKFGHQEKIRDFILQQHRKEPIDIIEYPNTWGMAKFTPNKIPHCVRVSSYIKLYQASNEYYDELEEKTEIEINQSSRFMYTPSQNTSDAMLKEGIIENPLPIIENACVPYDSNSEVPSLAYTIKDKTNGANYILFYGSISKKNGIIEIADCIYETLKKNPNVYFVFVGKILKPEECLLQLLKENAKEFQDRILWFDKQNHKFLFPIIKRAFGILMPARYKALGNACVESMMLRKIVIATEGNFSQLIKDGENGLLCKPSDSASLQEKINEFFNLTPEKKFEMEQAAFERTTLLSPDIITDKLLHYYKFVIDNWDKK